MPIWLRKFTFKKIQEFFDKKQEEIDKQKQTLHNSQEIKNKIQKPNIKPDYISKAPKK